MHLRGKSLKWVIVDPDGREQTILNVPKFDFNWQFNYELKEPLKIPAGSKILGLGIYDNSIRNKWNPGPHLRSGRNRAGTRCISRSPSIRWIRRTSQCCGLSPHSSNRSNAGVGASCRGCTA